MLSSLNTGISGLQQFQASMDVIGNNIANVNTTGYKSSRTEFVDAFSQSLLASAGTTQVGSGVSTSAVTSQFTQGTLTNTGRPTDLAIEGQGFFLVKDPVTNAMYATRSGEFKLDNDGYLVYKDYYRVQGYTDNGLTTRGDIKIDNTKDGTNPQAYLDPPTNSQAAPMQNFSITADGKIHVQLGDLNKSNYVRGQVLLQGFKDPQSLSKEGGNLYSGLDTAGPLSGTASNGLSPSTSGLGQIKAQNLEMSNVELTNEFARLITTQRAFQANARMVTTSDDILQELVNLKR